ncbi:hypothetical protein WR25_21948 [Diploscapter pachys]|uniref:Uncharacterized protein n=1 Tax=Diploscapter pachys TaxID=2018661 RepID=A0A2A2K547_9BILA|nr:hypothetical protein WR25_21948 [Diploscapter pachys]
MAAARAETMSPTYSEFEDKIAVNGVYLVNRHELSEHQDKELQRFIDNNAHIMYFVDREKFPEPRVRRQSTNSNYGELSKKLPRAPSPFDAYKSLDSTFRSKKHIQPDDSEEYRGIPQPYIEGYNYITDFPGIEQPSDNQFLEDILKSGLVKVDKIVDISRPNSPAMSRSGLSPSPSPYNSMSRSQSHQQQQQQQQANAYQTNYPSSQSNYHQSHSNYSTGSYNPPKSHNTGANYNAAPSYNAKSTYNTAPNYNASVNYNTNTGGNYNPSTNYSSNYGTGTGSQYGGSTQYETSYGSTPYASTGHYGSVGNVGQSSTYAYGSSQRSGAGGAAKPPVPPCSPYSSLKRKGVSWVDQDSRARSLSPMMVAPAYQRREVYSAIPQGSTEPTYTYSHTEFKLPPDLTGKQLLEYLSR